MFRERSPTEEMVADPPQEHLGRHALVNAVQQLLDEARACFCGGELQGAATLELVLGRAEMVPGASAVSEDLFPERGNTSEAYRSIPRGSRPRAARDDASACVWARSGRRSLRRSDLTVEADQSLPWRGAPRPT
jgi:hypothetical protein